MDNTITPDETSLPPITGGNVIINSPIVVRGMRGYDLDLKNTQYIYHGPPTPGIIQSVGNYWTKIRNFRLINMSDGVKYGFVSSNLPGGPNSHGCTFEDGDISYVGGSKPVEYGYGIASTLFGGRDANNELLEFRRLYSRHHSKAGFHIANDSSQSYLITFEKCHAMSYQGKHLAEHGYWFERYGSFKMISCNCWGHQCDIRLNAPGRPSFIEQFVSEHSRRMLLTNYTTAIGSLSVSHSSWHGEPLSGIPSIEVIQPGPVELNHLQLHGIAGVTPTVVFNHGPVDYVGRKVSGLTIFHHGNGMPTANPVRFKAHPCGPVTDRMCLCQIKSDGSRVNSVIEPVIQ